MNYKKFFRAASTALMIVIAVFMLTPGAWAQTKFKTLYKFTGGADGAFPYADLIFDQAGNLYGTTSDGGAYGGGVVFQLTPNTDGSWTESVLYSFCSLTNCDDGSGPMAGLILDRAGNLYGTTSGGGDGWGTVFMLTPNSHGTWTESVLHAFTGEDGTYPNAGLIFDQAGNLYGTTGVAAFKLTPNSDGTWTESVLHIFTGADGNAGLIFDEAGSLYGMTHNGGFGFGVVFELIPNPDGTWKEKVLHQFGAGRDGGYPMAALIFDHSGNLYGTTNGGGAYDVGVVFKLTPNVDGSWKERILHTFNYNGKGGYDPNASLILDSAGNLYGTTVAGGNSICSGDRGCGVVFKLAPDAHGGWTETVLHAFQDKPGANPQAALIFDAAGNLYGTTAGDGSTTFGSVFELTP